MNTGLKVVLGGVAAYLVYEWYMNSNVVAPVPVGANQSGGSGANSSTTQTTNQQANNAPAEQAKTVSAAALIAISGGGLKTPDQWNYYYSQISGVHQTANLFTNNNRNQLISVTEYLNRRSASGLSGLGMIFGVHPYYYANGAGPRGAQSTPQDVRGFTHATGWERARKARIN